MPARRWSNVPGRPRPSDSPFGRDITRRRAARRRGRFALAVAATALVASPAALRAQDDGADPIATALSTLEPREIGPAIMGGRVADLAVDERDPSTFYVGFATGGVWRTTNGGMTFEPLFDDRPVSSIGDVTLAPSNPNIVWVGTGEPQNRQSSPYGAGVFKSMDGGKTWSFMGLKETRHIARIAIHPANPDVVYVAAVGHLWGPNEERGVYRTTDGGASWEKVLYVDENTGAIDLVMHPTDPNTLFAAMYQRRRTPWGFSADGDGSGLYRTLDGGDSWEELTDGLPEGYKGRIGLDIYRRDGDLVYATVESNEDGRGLYRSTDRGDTWEKVSDRNPRPMYFSWVRIDPNDPERIYLGGVSLSISSDGGKSWHDGDGAEGIHVDHHAFWVDPNDSDHLITGNDGGVSSSLDRGEHWRHHNVMAVGQFYQVDVGSGSPYRICGGLQDNYSWCGPSETLSNHGIMNRDWMAIRGGDGFWNVIDPRDPDVVYTESQNGRIGRAHIETGEQASIQPEARPTPEDTAKEYRWNWNTPIHISHHDPNTVYIGANHLMRSRDRGVSWEEASPDVTRRVDRDTLPIMGMSVDSTTLSQHDGVSDYGTIVEIGESPLNADVLYVGTDDGVLHVSRDGGATWTDITGNVPGLAHGMVVSGIEPSYHVEGRVYLAYDGHWSDDYSPHVFISENYGEDWDEITGGLPAGASVNVIREHPRTPGLLFLGNEVGLFASFDRGVSWDRLRGETFPTVPVDDIRIHERENDLVVATHGRSIWILDDITPLEQIARDRVLASASHLFPVPAATMWGRNGLYGFWGDAVYRASNPPDGAVIRYWLARDLEPAETPPTVAADAEEESRAPGDAGARSGPARFDGAGSAPPANAGDAAASAAAEPADVTIGILDAAGDVIRTMDGPGEAGVRRVVWDLRIDPPYEPEEEDDEEGGGWWGRAPSGPRVLADRYTVRLIAAGDTMTTPVIVEPDPRIDASRADLETRQAALMRAYALAKPLHEAELAAEEAAERIAAAKAVLETSGEGAAALRARADSLADRVDELEEMLDDADPGRGLQRSIERISARPTADQLWELEQAEKDAPAAIEALNAFLTDELPAFERGVYQPTALPEPIAPVAVPASPTT